MKLFKFCKDGGPESTVSGLFFIEIKNLFSVALLVFENGSRDAYHSHAFNSASWLLKGQLQEHIKDREGYNIYLPSLMPIYTYRSTFHKVISIGRTWVLTFRGPWSKTWSEYIPQEDKLIDLKWGRNVRS